MVNEAIISKSLLSAINLVIDKRLSTYNFITLGKVVAINNNFTINVQPVGEDSILGKLGKRITKTRPLIQNVPFLLTTVPKIGEYCVLLHLDKADTNAKKNIITAVADKVSTPIKYVKGTLKPHSLNNCIAVCGFSNNSSDATSGVLNELTDITLNNNKKRFRETYIGNLMYPIGSIYISTSEVDPKHLFGGTWEKYAEGRTLIGSGGNTAEGTVGIDKGLQGGTIQHNHETIVTIDSSAVTVGTGAPSLVALPSAAVSVQLVDHLPPYIIVHMWKRLTLAETYPEPNLQGE